MTATQTLGVGIIGASRVAPQHALGVDTDDGGVAPAHPSPDA